MRRTRSACRTGHSGSNAGGPRSRARRSAWPDAAASHEDCSGTTAADRPGTSREVPPALAEPKVGVRFRIRGAENLNLTPTLDPNAPEYTGKAQDLSGMHSTSV